MCIRDRSTDAGRATARHETDCTLEDVCACGFRLLKDGGCLLYTSIPLFAQRIKYRLFYENVFLLHLFSQSDDAIIENLQREDLNPIEEAEGLQALIDRCGFTQEEVATSVGKSQMCIRDSINSANHTLCAEFI